MDFVCKLYGNTYAVHVTVALVGVATLNLALPPPPPPPEVNFAEKEPRIGPRKTQVLQNQSSTFNMFKAINLFWDFGSLNHVI